MNRYCEECWGKNGEHEEDCPLASNSTEKETLLGPGSPGMPGWDAIHLWHRAERRGGRRWRVEIGGKLTPLRLTHLPPEAGEELMPVAEMEAEREAVINCINLFGDSTLHKALDGAGLLLDQAGKR